MQSDSSMKKVLRGSLCSHLPMRAKPHGAGGISPFEGEADRGEHPSFGPPLRGGEKPHPSASRPPSPGRGGKSAAPLRLHPTRHSPFTQNSYPRPHRLPYPCRTVSRRERRIDIAVLSEGSSSGAVMAVGFPRRWLRGGRACASAREPTSKLRAGWPRAAHMPDRLARPPCGLCLSPQHGRFRAA